MSELAVSTDTGSTEAISTEAVAPVAPNIQKFNFKVDGEDSEEEIDFNNKEDLQKRFQLAKAARKRMDEAGEITRKAKDLMKQFDDDPESLLKRLGPKGRDIAEKYLLAQIQDEMLSPEEKAQRDMKNKLKNYEDREAQEKETADKSVAEKREYEYAQSFQKTIVDALETSQLPKTPELVKRMAGLMAKNLEYGIELTPSDLVTLVKNDIVGLIKSMVGDSDGDQLIALLGPDVANRIRKSDIKKIQEKQSQVYGQPKKQVQLQESAPKSKGYQTMEEFMEAADKRAKE